MKAVKNKYLDGETIREDIKKKFKSLARFCRIAEKDYHKVNAILRGEDPQALMELRLLVNCTWDRPLLGELTSDQKHKIRLEILNPFSDRGKLSMKAFCKKYKFDATWMSRLLSEKDYGAVRTNSPNLKRLLKILNLEL